MPGSVLPPVAVGVFPYSLSTKFTSSREFVTLTNEYHDGTTQRANLTGASRRTWKASKRLTPSEASVLRAWFDDHQADAFYFYDLRETSPIFSYDESGTAEDGRYTVRFNSDWKQTIGMPRSEVDVELIEIGAGSASDVISYLDYPPPPLDIVQVAKDSSTFTIPGGDLGPGTRAALHVAASFADPVTEGNAIIVFIVGRVTYLGQNIWQGPPPAFVAYTGGSGDPVIPKRVQISFTTSWGETLPGPTTTVLIPVGAKVTASRPNPTLSTIPQASAWTVWINGAASATMAPNEDFVEA